MRTYRHWVGSILVAFFGVLMFGTPQSALRAEESELVLKTAGEEARPDAKPETKEGKSEATKEKSKDDSNGAKKDEDASAKSQAKPRAGAQAEKPRPKYPPYAELLKEAQKLEGLITLYRKDDQLFAEIGPRQ